MFSIDFSRSKSRSISPNKSVSRLNTTRSSNNLNRSHLYELPKIPSYYKINRPSFSQHMKVNIQQKLNFQKQVQEVYKVREKNQDYFIKYKDNPFAQKHNVSELELGYSLSLKNDLSYKQTEEKPPSFYEKKRTKVYENIIQGVNDLRTKNRIVKDHSLQKLKNEATSLSSQFKRNARKTTHYSFKKQDKLARKKTEFILKEKPFQDIINMEEESYYIVNQVPINIFSIVKSDPKILKNTILDKYKFSFTSVIEKAEQKVRFPVYRDISKKARMLSLKNKFSRTELMEFISSSDINSNSSRIRFEDLLGLATGRCTPDLIDEWINHAQITYDFEEAIKDGGVSLKQNQRNMNVNNVQKAQNLREVTDWKERKKTAFQKYADKCKGMKDYVIDKVQKKINLTKKTVIDKKTHKELTQDIKSSLLYFLNVDRFQNKRMYNDPRQKHTLNKLETIKLEELIKTTKRVNTSLHEIQKFGNKTDKI